MPGSKAQKAVRACTIRLLNLGPAKHEVQNIQWMFVLHRPKRSVDSSDLRSKSADFECLQVLCASGTRLAPTEAERRPCVSCLAAEQFVGISWGQKAVRACTIRLLNLGPAKHEKVAIYAVNQRISNVCRCCVPVAHV